MKSDIKYKIKDIIISITLGWCVFMAFMYFNIILSSPLFRLIGYLPAGDYIGNLLEMLFLSGIWAVPVFWLISVILMIFVRKKEKQERKEKLTAVLTAVAPVLLAVFMLLTNFIEVLA